MSERFDAVAFMRRRREEIDREDEGLSWEERTRKTRESLRSDDLWSYLKDRVAESVASEPTVVSDRPSSSDCDRNGG
ncbi:hypothetical protein FJY68_13535 [candidate division WOR-3 bacterium]|uniref:Uncharacterized protein n=1 Tax=candidate division WOR-3 bacterium TaxID=2052148 RepID=A0A938BUN9_UNCW3|nr:hypothetical protein [candidate division WOR-3 bacterium]